MQRKVMSKLTLLAFDVLGLEKFMFSLTADELHRDNLKDPSSQVGTKIAGV